MTHTLTNSAPLRKILTGICLFFVLCVLAVIGYMAAGWKLTDSIYMVVITIFGVGYGEVQPIESNSLRLLTIAVIVSGYATVIYTVGGFMQMLIDGELNRALGARRMQKEIELLRDHTIVCGLGRLGSILVNELMAAGKPFVAVDTDNDRLNVAEERGCLVIHGDATDEQTLEQAGIRYASMVATVLPQDTANVFVTITAREMNADVMIIARGENPRTEKKLLGCGANQVVLPAAIGAQKVAQLIIRPTAENMLQEITQRSNMVDDLDQVGLQFDELDVLPESPLINHALSAIEIRGNHGFLIIGIRHANGHNELNPAPTTVLTEGDTVIVLGHKNDLPEIASRFSAKGKRMTLRGATV